MRLGDEKTSFRGSGAPRQRFFWPSRAHGLAAVLLLVGLFLALLPRGESFSAEPVTFEKDRLEIVSQAGARLAFDVEVAESAEQKAQGLMFRETLADDAGMIFFYPRPRIITMWMGHGRPLGSFRGRSGGLSGLQGAVGLAGRFCRPLSHRFGWPGRASWRRWAWLRSGCRWALRPGRAARVATLHRPPAGRRRRRAGLKSPSR